MATGGNGPQAALIGFSIRFRGVVIALACLLALYGIADLGRARTDVFPEFVPPQLSIQTEAAGLSAEQVETLVTRPIETALSGLPGLQTMQSSSMQGLSAVTIFLASGFFASGPGLDTDIYRERQLVGEQLAVAAQRLPAGVGAPTMTPLTSSTGNVLVIGLLARGGPPARRHSLMELRTLADWTVSPRVLAVPGVAGINVFGGEIRSLRILINPEQLVRHDITLDAVLAAARKATGVRGAGFIDTPNQRIVLQTEGQALTPAALGRTVILRTGAGVVTLADVAQVTEAPAPIAGAAAIDGIQGVVMNITEQYGANTTTVTRALEAALVPLQAQLARDDIVLRIDLFRPANFIATALRNIRASLFLGGALVIAVLFGFLFDLRVAAISVLAIPLSLLAATIALQRLGFTLNTMTLGGLAIAIGEVVDDAVIGVENIVRRLRESRLRENRLSQSLPSQSLPSQARSTRPSQNGRLEPPRPESLVVFEASLEVRGSVVYATLAVILVFLPLLGLPGVAGRLFAPLGVAYILAVVASLIVALTVTPALAMILLSGRPPRRTEPPVARWTRGRYARLLARIVRRPGIVLAAALLVILPACAVLPFLQGSFIPELKEGHFIVHMTALPGTSLAQSLRIGARVDAALRRLPQVRAVAQRVGRATLSSDTTGTHYSEFEVDLIPLSGAASERARDDVQKSLAGIIGANFSVLTALSERIDETLSGYTAALAVSIVGPDLDLLDRKAGDVARVLRQVRGATDVQIAAPPGAPQIRIRLRPPDLERWGLDAIDVLDLVHTTTQGEIIGQTYENGAVFDVIARLDATGLGDIPVRTPEGILVPLKGLADIDQGTGRYQISHVAGQRVEAVTANVTGRAVTGFARDAKAAIAARVPLPAGTYFRFAGTAEAQSQSERAILLDGLIAAVGIVILLGFATSGWRNLLLVLVTLPFALLGGVLAVLSTGGMLSLGSMVGFVTLFGITLRNAIMMISHYETLVLAEGRRWGPETAIAGAADRLVPILMTSLVTGLGLLPLALGLDDPGREIEGPMAAVILGGLLTSMALNLLVLPTLALRFARFPTFTSITTPPDALPGQLP